ncbi:MAG: response regulator [Ignavibacteria bacterium]|jgi:signal transduction histidine kinase
MSNSFDEITVLIVDDAPENIDILNEVFSDYKRKIATNGETALKIANSDNPPDIILLDIMMPGMDGFEVLGKLKENEKTSNIPVILSTAITDVKDKVKGLNAGAVDYITKPFQPEEVIARVETHLNLALLQKELSLLNKHLEKKVIERTIEYKKAKDKAEESSRVKSHFLALMSHELRTPMNGILGYAEILSDEIADPELKEFAYGIYDSGNRLKETLNSILNLSRLESSKQEVKLNDLEIVDRSKKLLKNHKPLAKKKKINLEFNAGREKIIVKIDSSVYDLIINNLVSNAVKFTDYGKVLVDLSTEKNEGFNWAVIKVKDTGIGIPKNKQSLIFEEFRQVDEGQGRNFEGVGLGLAIAKKYTELLNGIILLESDVGKGSTFTVKLPLSESEEIVEINRYTSGIKPKLDLRKILLVEDDETNIKVAQLFIGKIGKLDVATSGETAIELASQKQYDVVLMDINLGKGLNGIETTKEIRKLSGYQDIPIVAVTAYAMESDKEQFLKEGCSHYLPKPYSRKDILAIMESALKN